MASDEDLAALRKRLAKAMRDMDQAQRHFAAPYSSTDAQKEYFMAFGVCSGLAMAIEILDPTTITHG